MDIAPFLESESIPLPEDTSGARYPTWSELQQTFSQLHQFEVSHGAPDTEEQWEVTIRRTDGADIPDTIAVLTAWTDDQTPLGLWFKAGWPPLVVAIANRLAATTGPLVILATQDGAPAMATGKGEVQDILQNWRHHE